ncbi:helix-turn-helix domain-containing protein [Sphingomonas sp. C3-2]|uniref:helix-turn-helix domain-containing protein n=1 Tax=Sphingomonas sp. C3-2 TaxID=3062169 RepID=UPI003982CF50
MNKQTANAAFPLEFASKAYLTEREVSERLNVSIKWLQKTRWAGGGIPFAKFGSNVRYPVTEVMAFEQRSLRASTSHTSGQ